MKAIIRITSPISSRLFSTTSKITQADRQRIREYYTRGYQEKARRAYELKQAILNQDTALSTQISPAQQKKCEMLVDKIISTLHLLKRNKLLYLQNIQTGIIFLEEVSSAVTQADGTFEEVVPGYFIQQEIMSQMEPTVDLAQILGLDKGSNQKVEEVQDEKQEQKREEVREKDNYDIQLLGYDDKMKIKLIKEIRAMKKLGLKEAKEEIEGLPKWIYRGVKADEAKEIANKLKELGAEINMI